MMDRHDLVKAARAVVVELKDACKSADGACKSRLRGNRYQCPSTGAEIDLVALASALSRGRATVSDHSSARPLPRHFRPVLRAWQEVAMRHGWTLEEGWSGAGVVEPPSPEEQADAVARYTVTMIRAQSCRHPSWNPGRRHLDVSLADSIRQIGIQSPILVRPLELEGGGNDYDYEVVFGNRRVAGARAAGLTRIPAFVRWLSREEAVKLCGVENLQRQDLDPLEEADWLKNYLELPDQDLESTARTVGRSVAYVRERVHLAENLIKPWRAAHAGRGKHRKTAIREWRFSHLALVSQLAAGSQDALLERMADWQHVPTVGTLRGEIARETRILCSAPWKHDDTSLVRARPCRGCASRSDAQAALPLWSEIEAGAGAKNRSRCLDSRCWVRKMAAWRTRRISELTALYGDELRAVGDGYGDPDEWEGLRVVETWQHSECEKDDAGAFPAVDIRRAAGDDLRLGWWRKRTADVAGGKGVKKTLAQKRAELDGRRAVLAAERILDELGPRRAVAVVDDLDVDDLTCEECGAHLSPDAELCPGCGVDAVDVAAVKTAKPAPPEPSLVDPRHVIVLALVFGTERRRDGMTWLSTDPAARLALGAQADGPSYGSAVDPWEVVDVLTGLDESELLYHLWSTQVLPVIVSRLTSMDTSLETRRRIRRESERFCKIVGADYQDFWSAACEQKPEPKAWRRQELKEEQKA